MGNFESVSKRFGELELRCIYDPSDTSTLSWRGEMWRDGELIFQRYFFSQSAIEPFMAKIFILTGDSDE